MYQLYSCIKDLLETLWSFLQIFLIFDFFSFLQPLDNLLIWILIIVKSRRGLLLVGTNSYYYKYCLCLSNFCWSLMCLISHIFGKSWDYFARFGFNTDWIQLSDPLWVSERILMNFNTSLISHCYSRAIFQPSCRYYNMWIFLQSSVTQKNVT